MISAFNRDMETPISSPCTFQSPSASPSRHPLSRVSRVRRLKPSLCRTQGAHIPTHTATITIEAVIVTLRFNPNLTAERFPVSTASTIRSCCALSAATREKNNVCLIHSLDDMMVRNDFPVVHYESRAQGFPLIILVGSNNDYDGGPCPREYLRGR
jgi:hypothetical protein